MISTGLAVFIIWHVFDRHDHGDHALVTMTSGHLVAGLDAALDGEYHLDGLEHARRQVVAALQLLLLVLKGVLKILPALASVAVQAWSSSSLHSSTTHAQAKPVFACEPVEVLVTDCCARALAGCADGLLAGDKDATQALVDGFSSIDAKFIVEILTNLG